MTPYRGLMVDYYPIGAGGNIADTPPQLAIVTKVVTPDIVNLQILYDGALVTARTQVQRRGTNDFSCWDYMPDGR